MALSTDLKRWNLLNDKTLYDYTTYPVFQVIELEVTKDFINYALTDSIWTKFQDSSISGNTDDINVQKLLSALQNVFVRATSITFPSFTCDTVEIPQQFFNIKIQNKITFTNELTINFVEDNENNIFKFFKSWLDQILLVDYKSPTYGAQYNIANNYKVNITISIYKVDSDLMNTVTKTETYNGTNSFDDSKSLFKFKLHGFFPKSVNNPTYDYTTFEVVTRDVGFAFDYIEILNPSLT